MIIPGEGPTPCNLMFIGESPGAREMKAGRPFVPWAPAGKLFQHLLESIGLSRDLVYVTNLVKTRYGADKDPTPEQIREHEPLLWAELEDVSPSTVVTLGRFSTRHFLGDVDMTTVHGIPHPAELKPPLSGFVTVMPCFHPAAGLHRPETAQMVWDDFRQLDLLLKGEIEPHPMEDRHPSPVYSVPVSGVHGVSCLASMIVEAGIAAVDTEGTVDDPVSVQASCKPGRAVYVDVHNPDSRDEDGLRALQIALPRVLVVLQNAVHDIPVLRALGVELNDFRDTMVMAYNLCTEPQNLDALAYRHAGMVKTSYADMVKGAKRKLEREYLERLAAREFPKPPKVKELRSGGEHFRQPKPLHKLAAAALKALDKDPDADVAKRWRGWDDVVKAPAVEEFGGWPTATLMDVPERERVEYACSDADATLRVYHALSRKVRAMGLEEVNRLDTDVLPMVERMIAVGMKVDRERLTGLGARFEFEMDRLQLQARASTNGCVHNLGSNDQVRSWLFEHPKGPGLRPLKRTPKGAAQADRAVMEALRADQPVADLRIRYKELEKLKGTYVDGLGKWADVNGRIHPTLKATRVATGRLSSADPNVLAIPVRTELGKLIRKGFVADEGSLLGSWDYAQLELRILAHESRDENLVDVFRWGLDLHDRTERAVWDTSGPNRKVAKNMNFGIVYGLSPKGLQWNLIKEGVDWPLDRCAEAIREWFRVYPGVKEYMRDKINETRRYGYVRDMWGRIRYLPNIRSRTEWLRAEAEREAGNHGIQSGAAGVIKRAMRAIWRDVLPVFRREGTRVECLLQIHDELLFEFDEGRAEVMNVVVPAVMESAADLRVPLVVDGNVGNSWGDLK